MEYPLELQISVVRDVLVEDLTISDAAAKYKVSEASVRNWLKSEELTVSALLEADDARNLAKATPPAGLKTEEAVALYTLVINSGAHSPTMASHLCRLYGVSLDDIVEFGKSVGHSLETALNKSEQQNAILKQQVAALEKLPKEAAELKAQLRKAKALAAEKDEMINFLKKLRAAMKV